MLSGIDVSNNNGAVNWPEVARDGYQFAFMKRSEGTGFADPTFTANWAGAKAAKLTVGAYHFCHPGLNSPEAEAAYFLSLLPTLAPTDMVVPDIEAEGTQDRSAWLLTFNAAVEIGVGFKPIVYTYLDYLQRYLTFPALGAYPLWLADYGPSIPPSVGPWTKGAAIWQYSDSGSVAGISGGVDLNKLDRDLTGLHLLGKPSPIKAVPAHVLAPCGLKPGPVPSHASKALIQIPGPPKGICVDTGQRQTVGPDVWARITFRDQTGWVLAKNVAPN